MVWHAAPYPSSLPTEDIPRPHQSGTSGSTVSRSADAAKRKRDRDRDSQRRKRQREREYIENLEQRIREFQSIPPTPSDRATCSAESQHFVAATNTPFTPSSQCSQASIPCSVTSAVSEQEYDEHDRECQTSLVEGPPENSSNSILKPPQLVTVSLPMLEACLATPQWRRLPLHGLSLWSDARQCLRGNQLPSFIRSMRVAPTLEKLCPPEPKVIDIFFRGFKNPLANYICLACLKVPLPSPEKLVTSWTLYLYCRWLIWPSEAAFALLPTHLHPSAIQLTVQHPWCIDFIEWPEIRENMIRTQSRIDIDAAIGLLLCSTRMRGSFNSNPIFRQDNGELEIDAQLYHMFYVPGTWGLLGIFWEKYPDLVQGLDPGVRIREEDLLAA